jgi:hypothetical protein
MSSPTSLCSRFLAWFADGERSPELFQSDAMLTPQTIQMTLYGGFAYILQGQQMRISPKKLGCCTQLLRSLGVQFDADRYTGVRHTGCRYYPWALGLPSLLSHLADIVELLRLYRQSFPDQRRENLMNGFGTTGKTPRRIALRLFDDRAEKAAAMGILLPDGTFIVLKISQRDHATMTQEM